MPVGNSELTFYFEDDEFTMQFTEFIYVPRIGETVRIERETEGDIPGHKLIMKGRVERIEHIYLCGNEVDNYIVIYLTSSP